MYSIRRNFDRFRRGVCSVFTTRCICCGRPAAGRKCLCTSCEASLIPALEFHSNESFSFSRSASKYEYRGCAKTVLLKFKFSENYHFYMDTVFDWLLSAFDENFSEKKFELIIPVPSYGNERTRLSLIAERLAYYREIAYAPLALKKIRKTEKQHNLPASLRRANLLDAFSAGPEVSGKRVLLVDDIFTTGSTANECSRALIASGAEEVFVLTVLKTEIL